MDVPTEKFREPNGSRASQLRRGLRLSILWILSAAPCHADYVAERTAVNGTLPIESKSLADFIRFGQRLETLKSPAAAVKMWANYENRQKGLLTVSAQHPNAYVVIEDKGGASWKGTIYGSWKTADAGKDVRKSLFSESDNDGLALQAAVEEFAREETGLKKVKAIEIYVGKYAHHRNGISRVVWWRLELEDGERRGEISLYCELSDRKSGGLQLGDSGVFIWEPTIPRKKGAKDWKATVQSNGGSWSPKPE